MKSCIYSCIRPPNPLPTHPTHIYRGWRVPFLTGSILGLVGIFLRTQTDSLHEHPQHRHHHHNTQGQTNASSSTMPLSSPTLSSSASRASSASDLFDVDFVEGAIEIEQEELNDGQAPRAGKEGRVGSRAEGRLSGPIHPPCP